jgi:hypothetical protein
LAMQSCFAIFSTCLLAFLPDTPRWYYARGRYDEADKCLARLYSLPVESEVVQNTREEVLNSLKDEESDSESFNWWLLFWDNSELQFGRRLRTSFLILWAQQFLGINMLVYFSTQIFSNLGYSPMLSGILAGVMNTIFAIASYPPIWFIEKLGRRAMMFWCALGCGVCMIIYVGLTTVANPTTATNWAAVVFIILYNVVFAFGWLGTCWIYGKSSAVCPSLELLLILPQAQKLLLSVTATSPAVSVLLASGSRPGSWSSVAAPASRLLVPRSSSGRWSAVSSPLLTCGTTAPRLPVVLSRRSMFSLPSRAHTAMLWSKPL